MSEQNKSFICPRGEFHERRKPDEITLLDSNFESIEIIPGLKTTLFEHQKTVIRAMVELENRPIFQNYEEKSQYRTTAGILAEPVGSGKTVEILSLILLQKSPKIFKPYVMLHGVAWYKKFDYMLEPTIIIVGKSVINQWEAAIKRFTNLRTLIVSNYKTLINFIKLVNSAEINIYDIVLVKNGSVTRFPENFSEIIYEEAPYTKTQADIYTIISYMGVCWSRVVIDDFDVIRLPKYAKNIEGVFTWLVSSTKKITSFDHNPKINYKNSEDLFRVYSGFCNEIFTSFTTYENFSIRNTNEFIQSSNQLSTPEILYHEVPNPNDRLIGALASLDSDTMRDITEMLNADAVEDAAEILGIKTNSVMDIFEHVLGKHYDSFILGVKVLHFIKQQLAARDTWADFEPDMKTYKKADLLSFTPIKYKYPGILGFLHNYEQEYIEIKNQSSNVIERIRSNLQNGECGICEDEFAEEKEEIIIFKCCNLIICGTCCFTIIFKKNQFIGTCANCRKQVSLSDDIVYLSNLDFSPEDLIQKLDDENLSETIWTESANEDRPPKEEEKPHNKISTIIDILLSRAQGRPVNIKIPHLMTGPSSQKFSDKKKVLIFANYDSTLHNLDSELEKEAKLNSFKLWFLHGTCDQIARIAEKFNAAEKNCILLINSIKHCSGLNLQTATDLIFLHKIQENNIESQVVGRAQRLFRTSRLRIHYVLYKNEGRQMRFGLA